LVRESREGGREGERKEGRREGRKEERGKHHCKIKVLYNRTGFTRTIASRPQGLSATRAQKKT